MVEHDTQFLALPEMLPFRIRPEVPLDDDMLFELCARNPKLRIERSAEGELLIMSPEGGQSGRRSMEVSGALFAWSKRDGTGIVFGSSAGFLLRSGAMRSPDAAWVRNERWHALTPGQQEKFLPFCPDFVVEVASPSDSVRQQEAKLVEWIENGALLGWLLLPKTRQVLVYRADGSIETLDDPETVDASPVLPGFVLRPREIW